MLVHNQANLDAARLDAVIASVSTHTTLEKLIAAGFNVTDIYAADELSLDALVLLENDLWLVYHLT